VDNAATIPPPRPRLRGVLHEIGAAVAAFGVGILIARAKGTTASVAAAVYGVSLCGLLTTSAIYHRVTWSPAVRRWMRRLDHSMIFALIAGTYTPFCLLVLPHSVGVPLLVTVWVGAALGIGFTLIWTDAPKAIVAAVYIALGWVAVLAMPWIFDRAGAVALGLVLAGGIAYTVGAVVYARRVPDPWPSTFGYHEVFHALVLAAAACHFAAVAAFALPAD
jgi:hemolysin III